eukprot:GHVL01032910.1.p1 GENE.GHVL01032910.1~~GHVL01032910.1.p1  ORF type:complete len:878 (+),score=252.60 GHVL01032910.1:47-2635(+)
MGKKCKTGKNRLDKYYQLAKDQGYRARSAFKLIQLARKHDFLSNSTTVVDLCAAPGSWMQVAQKNMPVASCIIGIDIVPIKPIKGCTSIQADITTPRCLQLLKRTLNDSLADCVLHDGSPNIGSAWSRDAYAQNELVLKSLKLACQILKKGGTFVTKIFRSGDYPSLLWVFRQLFIKVDSTKPLASRDASAEIFVICQNYKSPTKLDPRFFDPKDVFLDTSVEAEKTLKNAKSISSSASGGQSGMRALNEFLKHQGKRNRGGYEVGDDYLVSSVKLFLEDTNPAKFLVKHNKLNFDSDTKDLEIHPSTTPYIIDLLKDIKVLGKRDLMMLLKWRFKYLKEIGKDIKKTKTPKIDIEENQADVDEEQMDRLIKQQSAKTKAEKRKNNELKKKAELRKKMNMSSFPTTIWEPDLFHASREFKSRFPEEGKLLDIEEVEKEVNGEDPLDEFLTPEEGEIMDEKDRLAEMEEEIDIFLKKKHEFMTERESFNADKKEKKTRRQRVREERKQELEQFDYQVEREELERQKAARMEDSDEGSIEGSSSDESEELEFQSDEEETREDILEEESSANQDGDNPNRARVDRWFSQDIFKGVKPTDNISTESEIINELADSDLPQIPLPEKKKKQLERKKKLQKEGEKDKKDKKNHFDDDEIEIVPVEETTPAHLAHLTKPTDTKELAEIQGLGTLMIQKRARMDLIDGAYNRYADNQPKSTLPGWFVEEEKKHNVAQLPLTKEMMRAYKAKLREINARPIRKVAEAKGRKKKREKLRLEKMKKQATTIAESTELNEAAKSKTIEKLTQKAMTEKRKKVLVVSRRSGGRKTVSSDGKIPKGAKVKVVDRRMKKDVRAEMRAAKKNKFKKRRN